MTAPTGLVYFAAPAAGASPPDLGAALLLGAPPGVEIVVARRHDLSLPKINPLTGEPFDMPAAPHAALAIVRADLPRACAALLHMADAARALTDPSRSTIVIGSEHIVKAPMGPALAIMLARRRAALTRRAYFERWLNVHAEFGRRMAPPGYRQYHADAAPADLRDCGIAINAYDGVGLVAFDSVDDVQRMRAAPEIARDATRDEMDFIDHSRSMLMLFRQIARN